MAIKSREKNSIALKSGFKEPTSHKLYVKKKRFGI